MAKLKPEWMKTDIPKDTKIKLWGIMRDCPTYSAWDKYITSHEKLFDKGEYDWLPRSRATYKALQDEINEMPIEEVHSLPIDLRIWIEQIRPDLKEQGQVVTEQQSMKNVPDIRLEKHFNQLAEIAKALAFREQWLLDNNDKTCVLGNIIEGLRATSLSAMSYDKELFPPVDLPLALLLLKHFNHQFPDLALESWDSIAVEGAQEVVARLVMLGYGKIIKICPACPVCQALLGIEHMSKGSIPIYEEKTNEILHEAPDWF